MKIYLKFINKDTITTDSFPSNMEYPIVLRNEHSGELIHVIGYNNEGQIKCIRSFGVIERQEGYDDCLWVTIDSQYKVSDPSRQPYFALTQQYKIDIGKVKYRVQSLEWSSPKEFLWVHILSGTKYSGRWEEFSEIAWDILSKGYECKSWDVYSDGESIYELMASYMTSLGLMSCSSAPMFDSSVVIGGITEEGREIYNIIMSEFKNRNKNK